MRQRTGYWRLFLFVLCVVIITVAVLGGAVILLPAPPGPPTPTQPYFLGGPESLPRLAY